MLSASRILKSINLSREVLTSVRLLSLSLNENISEHTTYRKRWKNEIEFLETNTRRYGRIDPYVFHNCLQSIRKDDITAKESLLLLKCCGPLMYNKHKDTRNEYLKEVWNIMKEKRVPIDILHYNLLIKMYIENEYKFDPQELLNEIKNASLEPNLRTYEFIINKYCCDGELDKVTELLEKMNEIGLSLTAPMFDSLILGHFINNDAQSALGTFELMKESGIEITSSTYKNLIIGHLKCHKADVSVMDTIKQLITENSVKFEITDICEIIDHIPAKQLSDQDVEQLKQFLIGCVQENENYYNDLSNCCYNLILKKEYKMVQTLYDTYFTDPQSRDYSIKRLLIAILKSDETKYQDFVLFLKRLHPSFNFSTYTKSTLRQSDFSLPKILAIMKDLAPVLDNKELGVYTMSLEKCKNADELHALTEQYLSHLDLNWINHLKKQYLPRIQETGQDLIEFMDEHMKRNKNSQSVKLLEMSIYCAFLDELEIDKLKQFTERFKSRLNQLSSSYLLERSSEVINKNLNKFHDYLQCLEEKLRFVLFRVQFTKLCIDRINDDVILKGLMDFYDLHGLHLPPDAFEERYFNKLNQLSEHPKRLLLNEIKAKLVNKKPIEIDDELVALRNQLGIKEVRDLFLRAIQNRNVKLGNFFFHEKLHLTISSILKYAHLRLENGEDKQQVIDFIDQRLIELPKEPINTLHTSIDQIFDFIKEDEQLVFKFVSRMSLFLDPSDLHNHLLYFFRQTNNKSIGESLTSLTRYLIKRQNRNRVFITMKTMIENKSTALLQLLCDKLTSDSIYDKGRCYGELAFAFVYTQRYKQALKVIRTIDFKLDSHIQDLILFCERQNKPEVIKQFAILVYQNSPKSRELLLANLNEVLTRLKNEKLFQEILIEIKQLNLARQQYQIDSTASDDELDKSANANVLHSKQETEDRRAGDAGIDHIAILTSATDKNLESRQPLLDLVDQIIGKKKMLKLSVECDLIDKLMDMDELENTVDLVYDMLKNERYPIPATIKNVIKELSSNGRIDLFEKLEPHLPLPLKESEFYKSSKIIAYLRTTDSEDDMRNCLKSIQIFSSSLIDQILALKPEFESQIVSLLKEKKKSNLNYIWLYFMKSSMFDKALDLVVNNSSELNVKNLLYQPVLNLVKQNNNLELARQLVKYANKFDLNSNTIQAIYYVYAKLCLDADLVNEVKEAIERHYKLRPNIKLDLSNVLDEQLIKKLDSSFLDRYLN